MYSRKMLIRLGGSRRTSGATEKLKPDRIPRRRVRILADDQHPHVGERLLERAQHPVARGQVTAPGGHFGPQEVTHRADLVRHRGQGLSPARLDDLA